MDYLAYQDYVHSALCCLGDWHIAYLLLYSPLRLEKLKEEVTAAKEEEPMDTSQSTSDGKPASSS